MNPSNYIEISQGKVNAKLDVVIFAEDNVIFAYAPALDLVGYDSTETGAKESFEVVFHEYIKYAVENNTLEQDLRMHGWKRKEKEQFSTLNFLGLLKKNERLQDVVNNDYAKVSEYFSYSFC